MMENIFDTLNQYRLKVERDGKSVVDVPGLLALPAVLAVPKLSIAGMIAAPLLGYSVRLEADGKTVMAEDVVKKAADTATTAAKSIKEEIDKAFDSLSADDPEGCAPGEENAEEDSGADKDLNKEIVEELEEKAKEPEIPAIRVNPEDDAEQ